MNTCSVFPRPVESKARDHRFKAIWKRFNRGAKGQELEATFFTQRVACMWKVPSADVVIVTFKIHLLAHIHG